MDRFGDLVALVRALTARIRAARLPSLVAMSARARLMGFVS